MEFSDYLVGRSYLNFEELKKLIWTQYLESVSNQPRDSEGFQKVRRLTDEPAWVNVRRPPFGDVLSREQNADILRNVLQRAKLNTLSELIDAWHCDLIREVECLGHYATSVLCARNLYLNRLEKKIVARYLVAEVPPEQNRPLIAGGEKIALMEGASGLFAAFAAAAHYGPAGSHDPNSMCEMISSNGLLNCEFLHNPWIGKSFKRFFMIGGEADFDASHTPVHAGVYGNGAIAQFKLDWKNPGATTLVVPCRGITPELGPLAGPGDVHRLKHDVIESALKAKVHNVIFIADYSKMLPSNTKGLQEVFTKAEWSEILEQKTGEQVKIVTTPPKVLREAIAEDPANRHFNIPTNRKSLKDVFGELPFKTEDFEYNQTAIKFHTKFVTTGAKFYEALFLEPKGFNDPPATDVPKSPPVPAPSGR